MGSAFKTHGRVEKCIKNLFWKSEGTIHPENPGVDSRIV
jgi:hypothetical protein